MNSNRCYFGRAACLFLAGWISVSQGLAAVALTDQVKTKSAEQEQTVRLKAELIEVRAVITDRRGQAVGNLKKEDFELLENGRPQQIAFFSVEYIERPSERAIGPSRTEARRIRPPQPPARTIVVFIDTLHLSFSSLVRAKQALRKFIEEQLTNSDLVSVVTSGWTVGLAGEFTQDRRVLLYAIGKVTPWDQGLYASQYTPYLAVMVDRGDREALRLATRIVAAEEGLAHPEYVRAKARLILNEAAWRRKATLSMLRAVAERMAEMPGQRMVFLISDGFTLMDVSGSVNTDELNRAISRAVRSGITIYSLYGRGLEPNRSYGQQELENGLNALASDTGGQAFFSTNDLSMALQRVLDENRVYYVLGYYPPEKKDTRFRHIIVRAKNHPEYNVRVAKGYLPLEARKEQAAKSPHERLFQAIAAPLPSVSLGVAVSADFLEREADDAQVSLIVHLDGNNLNYIERDGRHQFDAELAAVIYNNQGKPVRTVANNVGLVIRPGGLEKARQEIYHFAQRVALKPGLYQVRVGVRELSTERMGNAMAWVEVPDLKRRRLVLSSLLIAEQETQGEPMPAHAFKSIVGQTVRRLRQGNSLVYYLMVYNASARPDQLRIQVEILDGQARIFGSGWEPVSLRMLGENRKGIEVGGQINLSHVGPGIYELRVAVEDPKSKQTAHRSVVFEVGP